MDGFLKLNRKKLRFAFVATSLIFLSIALIFLVIGYFNEGLPDTVLLITILSVAGIGFPIFIMALAYLEWVSKRKVRSRAFSKPPFNQLENIGFSKSYINEKSKWFFTEETKEGTINNFKIKCDVTSENSGKIQFKALVVFKQINKNDFIRLKQYFKNHEIIFDFGGITKAYDIRRPEIVSVQKLESDLFKFTELLKKEGFEPHE